jgi:carbonic anhydrase/acetyltransferase-like protein (isoleucine patch superfamily)
MTSSPIIIPHHGITPTIHPTAFIAPGAVIIGDVHIGADSSVWFGCVLRGDVNHIRVGARTNIQDGTVIHVAEGDAVAAPLPTIIGDDVTVGHMALLHACTVGNRALIGMKSCVMDGAVVEDEAMVATGAVVTGGKRVLRRQVWAGVPAKFWRELKDDEMELITVRAAQYVRLSKTY